MNIRSLSKNFEELEILVNRTKPSLICLTETWLTNFNETSFCLPNYNLIANKYRENRKGGGVAFFSLNDLTIGDTKTFDFYESVGIEVILNRKIINVCCIYIPPSESKSDAIKNFDIFLENLNRYQKNTILSGDFNIDILKHDKYCRGYENVVISNGFSFLHKKPTRKCLAAETCLDHVVVNFDKKSSYCEVLNDVISDH